MNLYDEVLDITLKMKDIKCYNCGNDLEYEGLADTVDDVYKEYSYDGLFGVEGYLLEDPRIECGTCYHFTEIDTIDFKMFCEKVKNLLKDN